MVRIGVVALLTLAGAVILVLFGARWLIDPNDYRDTAGQRLTAALGRSVTIEGEIGLRLGWPMALRVEGVRMANSPWGSAEDMLWIEEATAEVALWPLLRRELSIRRLTLDGVVALLERDGEGRANWQFEVSAPAPKEGAPGSPRWVPEVIEVEIQELAFRWRDELGGWDESFHLHRLEWRPAARVGVQGLSFALDYRGAELRGSGTIGTLQALLSDAGRWPLELDLNWGEVSLQTRGHLLLPQLTVFDLQLMGEVADLAALGLRLDWSLPGLPMKFRGQLRGDPARLQVDDFSMTLGDSDLAGQMTLEPAQQRAELRLQSRHLDLDALRPAAQRDGSPPLFSPLPWPEPLLPAADASLAWDIESLTLASFALGQVRLQGDLSSDRSVLTAMTAAVAEGQFEASAQLSQQAEGMTLVAESQLTAGSLGQLLQQARLARDVDVSIDAALALRTAGRSSLDMARSLDGHLSLVAGQGRIHHRAVGRLSSDLLGSLMPFMEQRDSAALNCLAGRFDFKRGVAEDAMLLFDTETLTLAGKGRVDLAAEQVAMVLTPRPKRAGLMNLAMPVEVVGPLRNPDFRLESGGLARRSAGVALAVVNPLVLLVPVVTTTFGGTENPCLAAVEEARTGQRAEQPESRFEGFMRGLRRVIGGEG